MQIAIDGPAGAGKSSIARAVAKQLNATYLDTGAMYRAVAYEAMKNDVSWEEESALIDVINGMTIEFCYDVEGEAQLVLNNENISQLIRDDEISRGASRVAQHRAVRQALVSLQQAMAKTSARDVVMDGRDIGTVVLPQAEYKFFITASAQARARRRKQEWQEKGIHNEQTEEELIHSIQERDEQDRNRKESPLCQEKEAILIDTTEMTLAESIQCLLSYINKKNIR